MLKSIQLSIFSFLFLLAAVAGCGTEKKIDNDTTAAKTGSSYNDVISMHGNVENLEALNEFIEDVNIDHPSSIRIVKYTIEGDPIYHDLSYENEKIQFKLDTTEDGYGTQEITTEICKDLIRTETEKELLYTLKSCTGEWNDFELLYVPYDVEKQDKFEIVLKYGLNLENEINTEDRELIVKQPNNTTAVVSDFAFTIDEKQQIYKQLVLANYLGQKDLSSPCKQEPDEHYYLKVFINGGTREFEWSTCGESQDTKEMTAIARKMIKIVNEKQGYEQWNIE